jgi:hypothetical protein
MLTPGIAHGKEADLYFERRGSGQALLLIVGAAHAPVPPAAAEKGASACR